MVRRGFGLLGLALALGYLSSCMLASGKLASVDLHPDAGNTRVSFLSAEGDDTDSLAVGTINTTYEVIAIVAVEQGELRLDVYDGSGAPAISIQGRPDQQVTRSARLTSDERGNLRFRVIAHGARNGSYQILYRRQS